MKWLISCSYGILLVLLSGCATWQGQVAHPNSRFAALPVVEPAAIPKATHSDAGLAGNSLDDGAFVPVLGQVVFGLDALNMTRSSRGFFDWQDPPKFVTVRPAFTSGTWDNAVKGVLSDGNATLSKTVGVKLSAGDKGIPLGDGKAITLKLGVDGTLKLTNLRIARINLANLNYVRALASATADKEAYFVGEVLVCDVNSSNLVGFNLQYEDPVTHASPPTLHAAYDANYSGVGLVLGATFNKVSFAGNVSFDNLGLTRAPISKDAILSLWSSHPSVISKADTLRSHMKTLGVKNPDIALKHPYTTRKEADGNVAVTMINPFVGGTETLVVDRQTMEGAKVILSNAGEYQIQYTVVSGNKLYALGTTVVLKDDKSVEETVADRNVTSLKWEAVDPDSAI